MNNLSYIYFIKIWYDYKIFSNNKKFKYYIYYFLIFLINMQNADIIENLISYDKDSNDFIKIPIKQLEHKKFIN